jgi:hypothetical protein
MARRRIGPVVAKGTVRTELAEKLAAELRSDREYGQPFIYEQEYRTGKLRVTVVWDAWEGMPLPERSATIGRAYELAEGPSSRDRIALASGLTVPEAHAAGMLPYEIIPAVRKGDPLTEGEARQALMEEGGTQLGHWRKVQLRLATQEEAEAARQRFIARFPGSEEAWVIHRDITAPDFAQAFDLADDGED